MARGLVVLLRGFPLLGKGPTLELVQVLAGRLMIGARRDQPVILSFVDLLRDGALGVEIPVALCFLLLGLQLGIGAFDAGAGGFDVFASGATLD